MSAEQNMTIARNFLDAAWNKRDFGRLSQYVAQDHVAHGPFTDQLPPGLQGVIAFASTFTTAFPDVTYTLDSQDTEGNLVRTHVTYHGTHKAELMGVPTTGRLLFLFSSRIVLPGARSPRVGRSGIPTI